MEAQKYLDTDISKMDAQKLGVGAIVKNWYFVDVFLFLLALPGCHIHFCRALQETITHPTWGKRKPLTQKYLGSGYIWKLNENHGSGTFGKITLQGNSFWRHPIFHLPDCGRKRRGSRRKILSIIHFSWNCCCWWFANPVQLAKQWV